MPRTGMHTADFFLGHDFFGDLSRHWAWLLALGVLFVVLGTMGGALAFMMTVVSMFVFGALLLVGGGAQVVQAFTSRGWHSIMSHSLIGVLYLCAGIVLITNPLLASTMLTLVLAGVVLALGILRIVLGFQHRGDRHWIWPVMSGALSIVLAALIVAQWPVTGLWVIGLLVAVEMIFHGWSYIAIALAARER